MIVFKRGHRERQIVMYSLSCNPPLHTFVQLRYVPTIVVTFLSVVLCLSSSSPTFLCRPPPIMSSVLVDVNLESLFLLFSFSAYNSAEKRHFTTRLWYVVCRGRVGNKSNGGAQTPLFVLTAPSPPSPPCRLLRSSPSLHLWLIVS